MKQRNHLLQMYRVLGAVLFLLLESGVWTSAYPQDTTATYADSELWFNSLAESDRKEIQFALIFTGDYGGILDGEFGNGTFSALKSFEQRNSLTADGALNSQEREFLSRRSEEQISQLGFEPFNDDRAGLTIGVPKKYLSAPSPIEGGYEWTANDRRFFMRTIRARKTDGNLAATYKETLLVAPFRQFKYRTFRPDFFIISGVEGSARFYLRMHSDGEDVVGILVLWPNGQDTYLRQLVVAISNSLAPLSKAQTSGSGDALRPAPMEKIEQQPLPDFPKGTIQTGTGFFVSSAGHLLTNAHVVEGCRDARVRFADGRISQTSILARNEKFDLAILKSDTAASNSATFRASPPLRLGTDIIIFGYPRLDILTSTGNVVNGLISGLAGPNDNAALVQISAPIQRGNSGGAVLDKSGNVVGVVVAKTNLSESANEIEVLQQANFAINGDVARSFLSEQKVPYATSSSLIEKQTADIADVAKGFTAIVVCQHE